MYWQYFSWQFARDWSGLTAIITALFRVTGLSGLWSSSKKDRRAGIAALAMFVHPDRRPHLLPEFPVRLFDVPRPGPALRRP